VEQKSTAPVLDGPSDGFEPDALISEQVPFWRTVGSQCLLKDHAHKQKCVTLILHNKLAVEWKSTAPVLRGPSDVFE
jgi:hypothetical protein